MNLIQKRKVCFFHTLILCSDQKNGKEKKTGHEVNLILIFSVSYLCDSCSEFTHQHLSVKESLNNQAHAVIVGWWIDTMVALEPYANIKKDILKTSKKQAEISTTLQQTTLKLMSDKKLAFYWNFTVHLKCCILFSLSQASSCTEQCNKHGVHGL